MNTANTRAETKTGVGPFISIVSPVYGCKNCLGELYCRLKATLEKISHDFEIILVNDASPDNAWETIVELAGQDKRVKGINLSRNFGQHYAITAGLDHCRGEWVVVMDCDLQDQPEEIEKLYHKAVEGFQIVFGQRIRRQDKWLKRTYSKIFYAVLGYLTNTRQDPSIGNFGIYHKKVIAAILSMNDYHRYFPTMVRWVGFKHAKISVSHAERADGRSAYTIKKLINMGMDIIISFSDKPLRLMVKIGLSIASVSFLFAIYNLLLFVNHKIKVLGYTSLIVSIWFLSGLMIMVLGVVGLYVGKTFDKVKERPVYLVMEKTFSDENEHD
ncbi:MAG: glycosyltransferase family 2 protein [Candidatus Aminicenantes bacterium]|nr:glycosyltransferase family 2 protein [Candidatus Aminicenantes bacterium]